MKELLEFYHFQKEFLWIVATCLRTRKENFATWSSKKKNLASLSKKRSNFFSNFYIKNRNNPSLTQATYEFFLKCHFLRKISPESLVSLAKIIGFLIFLIFFAPLKTIENSRESPRVRRVQKDSPYQNSYHLKISVYTLV